MTLRGKVKNGKVLLDNPKALPEGTVVEVRRVKAPFIGKAKNLPPDLSVNLDHYLYGHPKHPKRKR